MMDILSKLWTNLQLSGFRSKRAEFYEQIAKSIEMKETLRDFLFEELKIARNKKTRDASRALALSQMLRRVEDGAMTRYGQIFQGIVPNDDRLLLSAVDDAADKPAVFRSMALAIRQQAELMSLVWNKILPPLAILPGAFGYSYIMATQSLPVIVKIAPPEVWNFYNGSVRSFSEIVAGYTGILLPVVAAAIGFFLYKLPRWVGKNRGRVEQMRPAHATMLFFVAPWVLPMVVYRDVMAGRLFTALAVMLKSGRTLNDALTTIRQTSSPWMRWHLNKIIRHLETSPTEYAKAFGKGLMSPGLLARLSSQIRTTPQFAHVLIALGTTGSEEIRTVVSLQLTIINKMLMAGAGALIVFMLVGQLSISNSLREELSPARMAARQAAAAQAH
jgi:type II secretory pathway component PulF